MYIYNVRFGGLKLKKKKAVLLVVYTLLYVRNMHFACYCDPTLGPKIIAVFAVFITDFWNSPPRGRSEVMTVSRIDL